MKKAFFFIVILFMATLYAFSENVTMPTAQRVAQTFLNSKMEVPPKIHLIDFGEKASFPNFYVFGNEHCFVIVAADDCVHPVLGYSTENGFETNEMPENALGWLKAYDEEIASAVNSKVEVPDDIEVEWNNLLSGKKNEPKSRGRVQPLLRTKWDQLEPFNILCPIDSGQHVPAGCTAVAMAQIMNYWEHPARGIGSHSYTHPQYGELSANFSETVYDWDKMKNCYISHHPESEANAVATLIYHCGVAINMGYGSEGSGASSDSARIALATYFDYNPNMKLEYRSYPTSGGDIYYVYSDEDWIEKLKNEINHDRPVLHRGQGKGSHAFVCDGYDEYNYFHINWGWGGVCDGYFAIGALNPDNYSFNVSNAALFGCMPNTPAIEPPAHISSSVDQRDVTINWDAVPDAVSYKLYRDGDLIANDLSVTNYVDIDVVYGTRSYYVKSVSSKGIMSLKSNKTIADVHFERLVPAYLQVTPVDNDIHLIWDTPEQETGLLQYGWEDYWNSAKCDDTTYWGQRFPSSTLCQYAGMAIDKISVYIHQVGTYYVFIYNGDESGPTKLVCKKKYDALGSGWGDVCFDNPVFIDFTQDLWIIISSATDFPATFCKYTGIGVEDAFYVSCDGYHWMQMQLGNNEYSWMIKTHLTDGTYSYNIYRNGKVLENNYYHNTYTDLNLSDGIYDYYVTTNFFGRESDASNLATVMIGKPIEIQPNPAHDILYVRGKDIQRVTVFDTFGRIMDDIISDKATDVRINLSHYTDAVYVVKIYANNRIVTKRFVKE